MSLSTPYRGPKTMKLLLPVILLLGLVPAQAQQMIRPAVDTPEPNVSERVRLLENELERQHGKLDQLQKALVEQQATIQALLDKLNAQPAATATVATVKEADIPA